MPVGEGNLGRGRKPRKKTEIAWMKKNGSS